MNMHVAFASDIVDGGQQLRNSLSLSRYDITSTYRVTERPTCNAMGLFEWRLKKMGEMNPCFYCVYNPILGTDLLI